MLTLLFDVSFPTSWRKQPQRWRLRLQDLLCVLKIPKSSAHDGRAHVWVMTDWIQSYLSNTDSQSVSHTTKTNKTAIRSGGQIHEWMHRTIVSPQKNRFKSANTWTRRESLLWRPLIYEFLISGFYSTSYRTSFLIFWEWIVVQMEIRCVCQCVRVSVFVVGQTFIFIFVSLVSLRG